MIELIKRLIPGSFQFLLGGVIVGVTLLWLTERTSRWGRRWLLALALFYTVCSTPFGAETLVWTLAKDFRGLAAPSEAQGATAIVVLGGGSISYGWGSREHTLHEPGTYTVLRVLEAARVYRLLDRPLIIVSGGIVDPSTQLVSEADVMRTALLQLGVPDDRIVLEAGSRNTHEQAVLVKPVLKANRIERFVLVTSSNHMKRSIGAFQSEFLDPIPSAASCCFWHARMPGTPRWLPKFFALNVSEMVLYEYLALPYYWARGWLTRPALDLQELRKGI